ncbi:testis-expressed basic protein 1 isoform X2 [Pantherophis guttatus]|uniref:Testis-expressed basic protein 1 isoform X2 n=1 Tax=Pantherophis guttatus TaxID=94885 RepID=A0A6P9BXD1_PANGU|nr:testis-expressed basic protein 1 isoform X2 [Pantherophis guttatus]
MGKNKGSWRKFFCCAVPPETQSSTCINIIGPDHFKSSSELSEPDLELDHHEEEDDLYIEAEVQTSNVEIPEGNRWRWSRLHKEVELQTSIISIPIVEAESSSEAEVQIQTSFSSIPTEANAHAQTSFISLRSPTPVDTDAQIQTSFAELRRLCEAEAHVRRLLLSLPEEKKAQVQTSLLSLHGEMEAQVQTSLIALTEEKEAQVQTSLSSLPEEKEAQVQTSLLSLPEEKETQVQTSLLSLPEEKEIQVQTSLLSLPERMEAQVQTSLLSLPEEKEVEVQTSFTSLSDREPEEFLTECIQTQPLYLELLEKIASLPILVEAKVQTSPTDLCIPSQTDMQVQTSFSDYMSEKEDVSIENELRSKLFPQSSLVKPSNLYSTYINAEVQTLPVEAPPGNDWRTARMNAEAQVQTSFTSVIETPEIQVQPSELELEEEEEWEAPLFIEKKSLPYQLTEASAQTSDTLIRHWDKWRLLHPQASVQVQTSTAELLKKLSLLSQIENMDPLSHAEFLKNISSLSVAEPELQQSGHELMRKASSWSDIETQDRIFSDEHLEKRPFSAQALPTSEYESATPFSSSSFKKEAQVQTSDLELMKKLSSLSQTKLQEQLSSLSLIEAEDENQEITEGKEYLITPQVIEAQIRKWYHELPEIQTSASQTPFQRDHLWSPAVDSEVQTSYVEIPFGNRWRASRLQAETETQTSGLELTTEEIESLSPKQSESRRQPSLLEIWQARDLADAQMRSSVSDSPKTVELPPTLVVDSEAQTSLFDIWKVKEQMDAQVQTSASELSKQGITSPAEQVDNMAQTSFIDIWKAKELVNMQQQTSETKLEEAKVAHSQQLKADFGMQTSLTDIWRKKEQLDTQAQTSFVDILEEKEEPSLVSQTGDAQVQTSDTDIPSDLYADFQQQTSLELEESATPSKMDILPQASLLDLWKAKEESRLVSQMDAQMQTSDPEMPQEDLWHPSHRYADFQQQTSLEEAKIEAPQMDTQVQTSLLDIWKTKELNHAQLQTSWADLPGSTEKISFPSESEIPVHPSLVVKAESLPPSQVTAQVQTSSLDIWKTKNLTDAEIQTSLSYLTPTTEVFPVSQQTESSKQSSTPEILRVTEPMEDQIKTIMTDFPDIGAQTFPTDMHAPEDLPNIQKQSPGSPLLSSPSFIDESSTQSHMDASHALSHTEVSSPLLHMELPLAPSHMEVSPAPVHRDVSPAPLITEVSPAPLSIEEFPTVSHIIESPFLPCIAESRVPSRTSSPRRPSTPASGFTKTETFRLEHSRALVQKSLLELWTMREEAVLQMQSTNFGMSFEEDLRLFPKLVEGPMKFADVKIQDREKLDQISTVERKPKTPLFTEAQVQTSYVDIPRGKKWRSSRICTEAQVQTSSHEIRKDRIPAVRDHTVAKRVPKGPRRAAPLSVHLHIKMAAKH